MSNVVSVQGTSEITPYSSGGRIDPYAIFKLNFEALGGEKHIKSDKNFHFKGEMKLGNATFGIEEFISKPLKNVTLISSNFQIIYRYGDDGKNVWSFQDGNLNSFDDSNSADREVRKLWEEFAYTDPKNRVFTSKATRKLSIDGTNCYEVIIKNNKTNDVVTHYYDAETFLLKREIKETGNQRIQHDFADYQQVGNVKMAFKKDITFLNSGTKQNIVWNKIDRGLYISDSRFLSPPDPNKPVVEESALTGLGTMLNTYA